MSNNKYILTSNGNFISEDELYHHGVKGMKWGVRKKTYNGGGIAGAIRRKQRANAENSLNKVRSQQRQVDSELRELRGYDKNPSGLGKSKISTAIRRSQIKSLEKSKASLKKLEQENVSALKELDEIERYQAKKAVNKATRKMNKVKIKDLQKQYGELEDKMTYGKNADNKANARIERQMAGIDAQINKLKRNR